MKTHSNEEFVINFISLFLIETSLSSQTSRIKPSRLLKFCYVALLVMPLPRAFLWQPLTVINRQTMQALRAINQSIFKYDFYV